MGTAPALVGRRDASDNLLEAVRDARGGDGSMVLVAGEAGIGKTALVSGVADEAAGSGSSVAWGRAVEDPGCPPYWMWTQALRQTGMLADREHLGDRGAADRFDLFELVIAGLDAAGGLLLVLDDLGRVRWSV